MSWDKTPENLHRNETAFKDKGAGRMISYREAIREALKQALNKDNSVFVFGEGIDDPSGVFGTTLGLDKEFGARRVFDTPVAENSMTGLAIGASAAGLKPVLVHMRIDFMLMSMDQIVNHAAKWKYMFGGKASIPMVIRAIIGGGWGSAAQHSQALQGLFAHIPGLKVVMPATAYDAKGLFLSAIFKETSPVIFIEHRWLYDYKDSVPEELYYVPLGKAALRKKGRDLTLIASSFMSALANEAAKELSKEGIDIELIDLRTVKPLDYELLLTSVKKTRRAVILDFGYKFCGISSEVASFLAENAYKYLKAPILRIALPDVPTPCSHILEKAYYPNKEEITRKIKKLLKE